MIRPSATHVITVLKILLLTAFLVAILISLRFLTRQRAPAARRPPQKETMSRAEALAILDLDDNADAEAIIAAHRRLMQKVHPDKGGSAHLARQLNEAKRVLLRKS